MVTTCRGDAHTTTWTTAQPYAGTDQADELQCTSSVARRTRSVAGWPRLPSTQNRTAHLNTRRDRADAVAHDLQGRRTYYSRAAAGCSRQLDGLLRKPPTRSDFHQRTSQQDPTEYPANATKKCDNRCGRRSINDHRSVSEHIWREIGQLAASTRRFQSCRRPQRRRRRRR